MQPKHVQLLPQKKIKLNDEIVKNIKMFSHLLLIGNNSHQIENTSEKHVVWYS